MKIISWNLNGIASAVKDNVLAPVFGKKPDIICIQEIRTENEYQIANDYYHFWNHSGISRYSGTVTLTKEKPVDVTYGIPDSDLADEGRIITAELDDCFVVNTYAPRSQKDLTRHQYRLEWDAELREYARDLAYEKPVIMCGDFNVARLDIDIYPENMRMYFDRKGFVSDEISDIDKLLEEGFVDAFRELYPDLENSYTWWSNRLNKREQHRGWRLDYFFVSEEIADRITEVTHHNEIFGSDHCPIELEVEL